VPAEVSNTAGTYLCNHVTYLMLHHLATAAPRCRAGFIHLPQMREAAAPGAPSLPLAYLVRGVEGALRAAVADGGC
jgi:pyroglutamyl-peptidase